MELAFAWPGHITGESGRPSVPPPPSLALNLPTIPRACRPVPSSGTEDAHACAYVGCAEYSVPYVGVRACVYSTVCMYVRKGGRGRRRGLERRGKRSKEGEQRKRQQKRTMSRHRPQSPEGFPGCACERASSPRGPSIMIRNRCIGRVHCRNGEQRKLSISHHHHHQHSPHGRFRRLFRVPISLSCPACLHGS